METELFVASPAPLELRNPLRNMVKSCTAAFLIQTDLAWQHFHLKLQIWFLFCCENGRALSRDCVLLTTVLQIA